MLTDPVVKLWYELFQVLNERSPPGEPACKISIQDDFKARWRRTSTPTLKTPGICSNL